MIDHQREMVLQRLVDGELNDKDRTEYLAQLGDRVEGWRELALSFVETQVVGQACRDIQAEPRPTVHPRQRLVVRTIAGRWIEWAAVAACVLLTIGAGFGGGVWWQGRQERAPLVNANSNPAWPVNGRHANARPVMLVQFKPSPESGSPTGQVPVYAASHVPATFYQPNDPLPEALKRELVEAGFRINQTQSFQRIKLKDGRLIALPVDSTVVAPNELASVQ